MNPDRPLTDSHAHLSFVAERLGSPFLDAMLADWDAAWASAMASAMASAVASADGDIAPIILDPGVDAGDLPGRIALLTRGSAAEGGPRVLPPFLRLAAGIWPGRPALEEPLKAVETLESAIGAAGGIAGKGGSVSAIGEAGLDYYHDEGPRAAQLLLFEAQIDLAGRLGLPLIVHSRDAARDTIDALRLASRGAAIPVLIHCFGYGPDEARSFLDLGCHISFAGNLSYPKSRPLREACAIVPADRLLLETDAPYMNPLPLRGRPSSPRDIGRTYAAAAEARSAESAELARSVAANARTLFG